jgi:DNA-binding NarL/FixJ family response regulator
MNAPARKCRVFVVDNNADLARTLSDVIGFEPDFESLGCSGSGLDALERATAAGADVLILDFSLPGRNALAILDQARAAASTLSILVFTGYAAPELAREAKARGAAGLLVKGGPFEDLAREIRRVYADRNAAGHA